MNLINKLFFVKVPVSITLPNINSFSLNRSENIMLEVKSLFVKIRTFSIFYRF